MQLGSTEWFEAFKNPDHPHHREAVRLALAYLRVLFPKPGRRGCVRALFDTLADYDPGFWTKRAKIVSPNETFRRFVAKKAVRLLADERAPRKAPDSPSTRRRPRSKSPDHDLNKRLRKVTRGILGWTQQQLRTKSIHLLRKNGNLPDPRLIRALVKEEKVLRIVAELYARKVVKHNANERQVKLRVVRGAAMGFWGWPAREVAREFEVKESNNMHVQRCRYRERFLALDLNAVVRVVRRFNRIRRRRCQ
jgi:hypothetical protein